MDHHLIINFCEEVSPLQAQAAAGCMAVILIWTALFIM
jgi:hypothetical protein